MSVNLVTREQMANVFQCIVFIFENERQTGYDIYIYCKIKLFSGAILHGTSYEPEATREATRLQTSTREPFCKNS